MNPWDILGTVIGWALVAIILVVSLAVIAAIINDSWIKMKNKRRQAAINAAIRRMRGKNDG